MSGLIPKGVSVRLPEAQEQLESIRARVADIFSKWGFREVGTPVFEYYDEVHKLIDDSLGGALVKLVERETGKVLVLRPDFTPQVARLASTVLRDVPRPLRLFYKGSVFRWQQEGTATSKQISQIGLELIGLDRPEACAELVGISEEVLEALGISDYTVAICNVSFLRELLSSFEEPLRKRIAFALARKDKKELSQYLEGAPPSLKEQVMRLPDMVGGPEILDEIDGVFSETSLHRYIEELRDITGVLERYGLLKNILIDLSEIRGMVYHRGFFFEVFVEGVGRRVAVGGRYDDLMGMYGVDEPAMGFAFNLEELYRAVITKGTPPEGRGVDVLVVDLTPEKRRGVEIARTLRDKGFKVARDIIKRELEGSVEYARVHGMGRVVVIREDGAFDVVDPLGGGVCRVEEWELAEHLRRVLG